MPSCDTPAPTRGKAMPSHCPNAAGSSSQWSLYASQGKEVFIDKVYCSANFLIFCFFLSFLSLFVYVRVSVNVSSTSHYSKVCIIKNFFS